MIDEIAKYVSILLGLGILYYIIKIKMSLDRIEKK
jgi:hypothetical protein